MIEEQPGKDWRDLQERVGTILKECGLKNETNKPLQLARGAANIDVYASDSTTTPPSVYLCGCKRWRQHVPQAEVQGFRTVMADAGAHFGLFISAGGFQAGAFEVVKNTNVHLLDWQQFQDLFVDRWCTTYWIPTLRTRGGRLADYVEAPRSDAAVREAHGQSLEEAEAVGLLVLDMWGDPFNNILSAFFGQPNEPVAQAIWLHRDKYKAYLPKGAAEAKFLRDLLSALLDFIEQWHKS